MARNLQSKSFVQKKRRKMFWSSVLVVFILIIITVVISWLMRLSFLTISDVNVFGADADITTGIHDVVINDLDGKYMGLFPHKNTLIYPKSEIISTIKAQFPRVLDMNVSRNGLTGLQITVNEKTPSAIVCATLPNFVDNQVLVDPNDPCYFSDDTGLLFEKSTAFSGHPYNIYYAPDIISNSTSDYIGSYATSTAEFTALQNFYNGAQNAGIEGDAILIKPNGEYEFYSSSTTIYFNNTEEIPTELSNLLAFWNNMVKQNHGSKSVPIFDYIDLRYDSNVFYKILK